MGSGPFLSDGADVDKKPVGLSPQEQERGYHVVARLLEAKNPNEAREWMHKLPDAEQPYAMSGIAVKMAKREMPRWQTHGRRL